MTGDMADNAGKRSMKSPKRSTKALRLGQLSPNTQKNLTVQHMIRDGYPLTRENFIRLAGLLIAWGLVLGRAVAGDWESIRATIFDFKMQGWPSLVLLVIAIFLEFRLRPSRKNLSPSVPKAGIVPAFIYVLAASLWFARLGLIH